MAIKRYKEIQRDNATSKMYGMCTILLVLCLPAALAFKYPKDSDGFWRRIFHTKSFYVLAIIAFWRESTDYGHMMAKSLILCGPFGNKGIFFCRNNGWLMKNMDKGLTLPTWVLINWPKIPQMPKIYLPKLSAQAQKFGILMKKGFIGRP